MKLPIVQIIQNARSISTKYHVELQKDLADNVTSIRCRVACSGCCHRKVNVTLGEALSIYLELNQKNLWDRVKPDLPDHVLRYEFLDPESWGLSRITCPLLDQKTNLCSVYQVRPMFCAVHFALGDPRSCDPHNTSPEKSFEFDREDVYGRFRNESLEKLLPVFMNMSGSLAQMLLYAEKLYLNPDVSFEEFMKVMS